MNFSEFYESVYSRDNPTTDAHGCIQWEGTNVCIDLHCHCGHHGHFDGPFFYHYKCPGCGACFAVGLVVKLIPLTAEEVNFIDSGGACAFRTSEEEGW